MWKVEYSRKAQKQIERLPPPVKGALILLVEDIEKSEPVRGNWPNYSKLDNNKHHCHLRKGKPTYVAVWQDTENGSKLVEITYAGTHEKAPY